MKAFSLIFIASVAVCQGNIETLTDKEVIALTLWGEARGEGSKGIEAVASVIYNRATKNKTDLRYEALKKFQFSFWNGKYIVNTPKDNVYKVCLNLASKMVSGNFKPTHNYRHYYNPSLCSPRWARNVSDSKVIGNHRFVSLKGK